MSVKRRVEARYNSEKEEYRIQFLFGFFEYIKEHNSPIDFFSWHTYGTVDIVSVEALFLDKVLKQYGYEHIETHLNEWNLSHNREINKSNSYASCQVAAMMCEMQHQSTNMLMYYDSRYVNISAYAGFYDVVTYEPSCVYYVFKAFGELFLRQNEVKCEFSNENLCVLAASDNEDVAVLITNRGDDDKVEINLTSDYTVYLIDENNLMTETDKNPVRFMLGKHQTVLIKK